MTDIARPPGRHTGSGPVRHGPVAAGSTRVLAAVEVAVASVAVLADWFIPAVVLVALAAASLLGRRRAPASLGFRWRC